MRRIRDADIALKGINLFIGPSAAGKSIIAKLLYFCQNALSAEFIGALMTGQDLAAYQQGLGQSFAKYFPPVSWPATAFEISHYLPNYGRIAIQAASGQLEVVVEPLEGMHNVTKKGAKLKEDLQLTTLSLDQRKELLNAVIGSSPMAVFIPAGRGFFANIQDNLFSFLSLEQKLDPFLVDFGSYYEGLQRSIRQSQQPALAPNLQQLLGGQLLMEGSNKYIVHSDGRKVPLESSSSGQQELLPLLLSLKMWDTRSMYYIEEPEAHLFPSAQKAIVEQLAQAYNQPVCNNMLTVTTHSPYILSVFNNLLKAGYIAEHLPQHKKKVAQILPEETWLKPRELAAYEVRDGEVRSISCPETQLILAEELDGVSDEIGAQFGDLLDIEFGEAEGEA